jgi:acetyl esterase/lipase
LLGSGLLAFGCLAGCSSDTTTKMNTNATTNTTPNTTTIENEVSTTMPTDSQAQPLTITYGSDPSQFGQLWLPAASSIPVPIVVLIHGGFWRAQYGLDLMDGLAADLVARGFAAWNVEYRRVGQPGGGYPGTLEDVGAAIDALVGIAATNNLDLNDVVFVGHSAGGQLSLWAAGRGALPPGAPGSAPAVVPQLAIGQGPVFDMAAGDRLGLGGGAVTDFIGGSVDQYPDRYAIATPSVTAGVPLAVVRGAIDDIVPAQFAVPDPTGPQPAALQVVDVPGADYFALIDPTTSAWQAVVDLILNR